MITSCQNLIRKKKKLKIMNKRLIAQIQTQKKNKTKQILSIKEN